MKKIIEFKDFTFRYQAQQEPTLKDIHTQLKSKIAEVQSLSTIDLS
ncbi:hypothetical protein ODU47_11475 [Streptococcus suis]